MSKWKNVLGIPGWWTEDTTVISEIQGFVDYCSLDISKEKLAEKVFYYLDKNGHDCWILNGKYVGCDGEEFQFIKSHKENRWIVRKYEKKTF